MKVYIVTISTAYEGDYIHTVHQNYHTAKIERDILNKKLPKNTGILYSILPMEVLP